VKYNPFFAKKVLLIGIQNSENKNKNEFEVQINIFSCV
jgi:hypothetical protein